ncbi:MAG: response regulator transcription factor [Promethearchaeota archaeon]
MPRSFSNEVINPARYKILVVDDEPNTRSLAKMILEFEGFKVFTVSDGRDALEIIKNQDINLVLLDIRLPKMDGFEVCRRIKNMDLPAERMPLVIFFTVLSFNVDKEKAKQVGGDGFLVKPFSADELVKFIKEQLKMREQKGTKE